MRSWQNLARLRPCPKGLSRGIQRLLRAHAAALRTAGARPRRRQLCAPLPFPIKAWYDLIGEPTFADAILDRLVHNAYRLELEGQRSMRETEPDSEQPAPTTPSASNGKSAKGARK